MLPRRIAFLALSCAFVAFTADHWVATWAPSPSPQLPDAEQMRVAKLAFENQTLRQVVHISLGGDQVRLRLSNRFGQQKVEIGAVHLALRSSGAGIVAGSDHTVTFGGRPSVTIPANAIVLSDPVSFKVPNGTDLAVSLFLPKAALGAGIHYASQQTNYVATGDLTAAPDLSGAATIASHRR